MVQYEIGSCRRIVCTVYLLCMSGCMYVYYMYEKYLTSIEAAKQQISLHIDYGGVIHNHWAGL